MRSHRKQTAHVTPQGVASALWPGIVLLLCQFLSAAYASPTALAAAPSASIPARQAYLKTEAAFLLDHDTAKAEEGFRKVTKISATYAPAWFNLGVLAEGRSAWAQAQEHFEHYLALQPAGADADRARAQLQLLAKYQNGSMTSERIKDLEYGVCMERARAFLSHGLYREAIAEAGRAQSSNPSRWEAYAIVSLTMAKQHKPREAAKFSALALEHAPVGVRERIRVALTSVTSEAAR